MQRTWLNRKIVFNIIISIIVFAVLVFVDQFSKYYFKNLFNESGETNVIKNFLFFTYTFNEGAAYGMFGSKPWAQTFFKVLTIISMVAFIAIYIFAIKKNKKFLSYIIIVILAGTLGNFIDRVLNNGVIDFICLQVNNIHPFGIFNFADILLSVGVVLIIVYLLFVDEDAVFKKKNNGN